MGGKLRAQHRGRRYVAAGGQEGGGAGLEDASSAGVCVHPSVKHVVGPPEQRRHVLRASRVQVRVRVRFVGWVRRSVGWLVLYDR